MRSSVISVRWWLSGSLLTCCVGWSQKQFILLYILSLAVLEGACFVQVLQFLFESQFFLFSSFASDGLCTYHGGS